MLRVVFYTDGSCLGNPGVMGAGIVAFYGNVKKEYSISLGEGSNNRAELLAILYALKTLKHPEKSHVTVYSDSQWAVSVLNRRFKARLNLDIIEKIRKHMAKIRKIEFIWIKGHAGDRWNERANFLARKAARSSKAGIKAEAGTEGVV